MGFPSVALFFPHLLELVVEEVGEFLDLVLVLCMD